jgi:chemotaxis protein MotB
VVLEDLVKAVNGAPGHSIRVVAHTDDTPYHTAAFDSNWELGFAEALVVARVLSDAKTQHKVSAASAAGSDPLDSNETPEGRDRNRRVELWIEDDLRLPGLEESLPTVPPGAGSGSAAGG